MNRTQDLVSTSDPSSQSERPIPKSLLRLRQFLFEYGMPMVPWATADEVLEEFYALLCSNRADDDFWGSLGDLLRGVEYRYRRATRRAASTR